LVVITFKSVSFFTIESRPGFVASVLEEKTNLSFEAQNQADKRQKDLKAVDFGSINCPFFEHLYQLNPG
jgi:hypothetical protein